MAAVELTVQSSALAAAGLTLTQNAAAAAGTGNKILNSNGRTYLVARNGSGSSVDVTISTQQTVSGAALTVPDLTVSVGAGVAKQIGPFPTETFNDSNNYVEFDVSLETSVTYEVFEVA